MTETFTMLVTTENPVDPPLLVGQPYILATIHRRDIPGEGESERRETYQWIGPTDQEIFLDCWSFGKLQKLWVRGQSPKTLDCFPWRLRLVREDHFRGGGWYMREDGFWISARVKYWLRSFGQMLKCRIIWTLAVWNLARCQNGAYPDWSDIGKRW